jgi:hypothetical protein
MILARRRPSTWSVSLSAIPIAGVVLTAASLGTGALTAQGIGRQTIGVIVDRGLASADPALARVPYLHVFDPETSQITAGVPLPTFPGTGVFDVEIAPDLSEAYVADNNTNEIWFIDLTTDPPSLSNGVNPLYTPRGALDLALTPDGRYLLATSGNGLSTGGTGMGVIDVRSRTVASTRDFLPYSPTAVEVAPDGSVLVAELHLSQASYAETVVRRFTLDNGTLVDTGESVGTAGIPGIQDMLVPDYPHLPAAVGNRLSRHVIYCSRPAGQHRPDLRLAAQRRLRAQQRVRCLGSGRSRQLAHRRLLREPRQRPYPEARLLDRVRPSRGDGVRLRADGARSGGAAALRVGSRRWRGPRLRLAERRARDDHDVTGSDLGARRRGPAALMPRSQRLRLTADGPATAGALRTARTAPLDVLAPPGIGRARDPAAGPCAGSGGMAEGACLGSGGDEEGDAGRVRP